MNKNSVLGLGFLLTGMLTACNPFASNDIASNVEYIPFQLEEDGKWGMINGKGDILFSEEFKNQPSQVVNGIFSVQEGDNICLYTASEKPELISGCDDLTSAGYFNEGVIPATHKKNRITLLNKKGETVATLEPVGGKEIIYTMSAFSEGLLPFALEDKKCGAVDDEGKVVIEPKYDFLSPCIDGKMVAMKSSTTEDGETKITYSVLNKKGEEIFKLKKDQKPFTYYFKDGLLPVTDDENRCGFLNEKGEFTKPSSKVKRIGDFNKKYFAFSNEDDQWGLMDMEGNVMIRAKYGSLQFLSDGNFLAKDDEDYLILDEKGDKIFVTDDYEMMWAGQGDIFMVGLDGKKLSILDKEGKSVSKDEFTGLEYSVGEYSLYMGEVSTDYFNADGLAQTILDAINPDGIGKVKIGETASELGIDYNDYVYTSNITCYAWNADESGKNFTGVAGSGWRYNINTNISFDEYLATRNYGYYGYSYSSTTVGHPDAKVSSITMEVSSEVEFWKDVKKTLVKGLEKKGFNMISEGDDTISMTGNATTLSLRYNNRSLTIEIAAGATQPMASEYEAVDSVVEVVE